MRILIRNSKRNVIIILTILFIILSILMSVHALNNFESVFYYKLIGYMSPLLTIAMKAISYIGNTITVVLICIILTLHPKTRWKYGGISSVSVIASFIANMILKLMFARERPDIFRLINETNYSFPSGHAMISTTLYSILGICIYKNIKNKTLKYILISICILIPFVMGISRVYLGVHYITDVMAGWIGGLIISISTYLIYKYLNQVFKIDDI